MAKRRAQLWWDVFVGLISGPILAALVMLLPLGVLTGVSAALDPSLAMYEFTPEEDLLLPWIILAVMISAANIRLALVMSQDTRAGRIFSIETERFLNDPSGEENVNGHRGKQFVEEFTRFLVEREGDRVHAGEPVSEDYGWGFWLGEKGYSPLLVAIAHGGRAKGEKAEQYLAGVTLEPPLMPWRRLTYKPDIPLRDRVEKHLSDFLTANQMSFTSEIEEWVDPGEHHIHEARF
jgi:hypothetical protein